ncbi:hypothetical protein [Leucobacter musarum]|uniref:hypothetical protein n=1 Tax=Leucobacter musarum TaxID=1930747 RepID=UPI0006A79D04|nr:hypothetical protein [Leucobacter musarum]
MSSPESSREHSAPRDDDTPGRAEYFGSPMKPAAAVAWNLLGEALDRATPLCAGNDKFIADTLTPDDRDALAAVCELCPIRHPCAAYAAAAKPTGAFWPTITTRPTTTEDPVTNPAETAQPSAETTAPTGDYVPSAEFQKVVEERDEIRRERDELRQELVRVHTAEPGPVSADAKLLTEARRDIMQLALNRYPAPNGQLLHPLAVTDAFPNPSEYFTNVGRLDHERLRERITELAKSKPYMFRPARSRELRQATA